MKTKWIILIILGIIFLIIAGFLIFKFVPELQFIIPDAVSSTNSIGVGDIKHYVP